MAQPRFLFVSGDAGRHVWTVWQGDAGAPAETADRPWVAWRLAAANNRELGRSAIAFADLSTCREAADRLRRDIARAEATTLNEATGLWRWRLDLDGLPVATSARLYLRQRECHYNLAHFRAAVPVAVISTHVLVLSRDRDRTPDPPGPAVLAGDCALTGA